VVYTTTPEGEYTKMLTETRDRFDVSVGSYPSRSEGRRRNRIKLLGEDETRLAEAADWIEARVDPYEGEEAED
jgi:hypothetical protein